MPKLANGCRLFLPLFENSHGVARTYYYGTAHPSRLGRAGCSGRCRHGSQKFAVALGLVRRLSRSSIASTVESGLKTLRSTQSGKPVRPTASTGFLEWAMGIEPKNYILSLADSTPLAAVTRSNPGYQYPILDYSWTTNLPIPHFEICRIWR